MEILKIKDLTGLPPLWLRTPGTDDESFHPVQEVEVKKVDEQIPQGGDLK